MYVTYKCIENTKLYAFTNLYPPITKPAVMSFIYYIVNYNILTTI